MPFCHKCGNRVTDRAKFCNKCGTKIRERSSTQHYTSSFTVQEKPKPSFDNLLKQKQTGDQRSKRIAPVDSQSSIQFNYNEFQITEKDWFNFQKKTIMLQRLSTYVSYIEDVKKETENKLREIRRKKYQVKKEAGKLDSITSFKSFKSTLRGEKKEKSFSLEHQLFVINEQINSFEEENNLLDDNLTQANNQAEEFRSEIESDQSEEKFKKIERLISGSVEFSNIKDSVMKLKNYRKSEATLNNDLEDTLAAITEIENCIEQLNSLSDALSDCERITSSYYRKDGSIQSLMEKEEILNARQEMIQIKVSIHKTKAYIQSLSKNNITVDLSFINMDKALESILNDILSNRGIIFKSEISGLIFDINTSLVDISDTKVPIEEEILSIKTNSNTILEQLKSHSKTTDELSSSFDKTESLTETNSLEEKSHIETITIEQFNEMTSTDEPVSDIVEEETKDSLVKDEPESLTLVEVSEQASAINLSSDLEIERAINQQLKYSTRKIEKIGKEVHVTLMSGDIKKQLWVLKDKTIEIIGEGKTSRADISIGINSKNREGAFNWSKPWDNVDLIVDKEYLSKLEGRRLIAEQIYKLEGEVKIDFSRSSKIVKIVLVVAKTSENVKAASQTFKEMVYLASSI
ncbi:MAG: zinc-ribbon domain-containing protein [Candidatus Kariarchaeaceae archaeon]